MAGGYGGRNGGKPETEIYSYKTKEWTESGKLPDRMFEAVVSNIDNRVLAFSNRNDGVSNSRVAELLEYDIATGSWSVVGLLNKARRDHSVTPVKFSDYSPWCTF